MKQYHAHQPEVVARNTYWRIVKLKRGDCVIGYKVQKLVPDRAGLLPYWVGRGRRQFTQDAARDLREFLIQQDHATSPPIVDELVE